ncbi:hypothetical protein [Curtobacterium sp. BRD11]|uniref:hypothetical protein n=1 Tax=Curtobacterium sp. BRD11 TaxID=2962581 RepID=UPI002882BA03|nr:hypothetical protein [Curtobacterium sp. BRD11]MDT0211232.1 hypothetical protein [Curtobacterium sp. BRD11]
MPKPMMVVPEWVEAHCVIPDQESRGEAFILGTEQLQFMANHYTVRDDAKVGQKSTAFVYRRSLLVRSQKWGKSPLIGAFVCVEGVGPVLFAGWARGGEVYDCRDFGCGCGWLYEYEPGEPMGRPWATPLIQITATSEDQTDNTYDALRPMIELGPLAEVIPKTGEEFIRLPNDGRIDVVTSKATSRLGQRVTFVPQDETGLWVASNGGHNLAKKQRQGLAGMGGRAIETTNAWDPSEDSVAQRTFASTAKDLNKDFRQPPSELNFHLKRERRRIFQFNYAGAPWVDIDAIEGQAFEMLEKDPADAERFFGNRIVPGQGRWLDSAKWGKRKDPREVPYGARVCLGFDGSDNDDYTGIRLETLDYYQFTPTYGDAERPTQWRPQDWGGRIPRAEVRSAVEEICKRYDVVRAYLDPKMWETEIDEWGSLFGEKTFIKWPTNQIGRMWPSLERFRTDVYNPDSQFTHDGDPELEEHTRNAVVRSRGLDQATGERRYILGKASEHQKFDYLMSSTLAHEAVCDAIAAGANNTPDDEFVYY